MFKSIRKHMGEQNQSTEILSIPDLFVQLFNVRNTQISTIFFPKKNIFQTLKL